MNKIVKHHYPVSNLPPDLREGMPIEASVSIRVELEDSTKKVRLAPLVGSAMNIHGTPDEAVAAIRVLRDEW